jgi:hypothetical protein
LPQTTDLLNTNLFAMLGLAFYSSATLGQNTVVAGLACTPTSPASLTVDIGPGSIYAPDEVDATAYGDLGTNTNTVVKQGINYTPVPLTITPPGTVGWSQVYLVEAILEDQDGGSMVVSYFNASNPQQPFAGPNNDGQSQFTIRFCQCSIRLKAGVAAPTGSQVAPTADAGYSPLFAITVANGQTQISGGNIVQAAGAPFFPTLPAIPGDVQANTWTYCVDQGTASAIVVSTNPPFASNAAGTGLIVKVAAAPTGPTVLSANGLGNVPVINNDLSIVQANQWAANSILVLDFDGSNYQIVSGKATAGVLTPLQVATTYYVNPVTGSDVSNNGLSAASPWATLNHAYLWLQQNINANGQTITISCAFPNNPTVYAPFTATGGITGVFSPAQLLIVGDTSGQTCTITQTGTSLSAVLGQNSAMFSISGFKLSSTGSIGAGIQVTSGAQVVSSSNVFGTCTAYATAAAGSGAILTLTGTNIFLGPGTYVSLFHATQNATLHLDNSAIQTSATVSGGTVTATDVGVVTAGSVTFSGVGTTGPRFAVASCSVLDTNGAQATTTTNYIPGNAAGTTASNGVFV